MCSKKWLKTGYAGTLGRPQGPRRDMKCPEFRDQEQAAGPWGLRVRVDGWGGLLEHSRVRAAVGGRTDGLLLSTRSRAAAEPRPADPAEGSPASQWPAPCGPQLTRRQGAKSSARVPFTVGEGEDKPGQEGSTGSQPGLPDTCLQSPST